MGYIVGSRMSGAEAADWAGPTTLVPAGEVNNKALALNRAMDQQGFSEAIMRGAEFDAIADDSVSAEAITEQIEREGLKQTIAQFTSEG